jgi:hypothetical protein
MSRKYEVEIEGKIYHVELRYRLIGTNAGEVLVNGEVVDCWGASFSGLPKERTFEIAGKNALLRKRGLVLENLELFVPGAKVWRV